MLATALAVSGCALPPRELSWTVEFDTPSLLARARLVRTEIRAGGCGGVARYSSDARPGTPATVPPALEPGRWGFAAEAFSGGCARFAGDCDELVLPGPTRVASMLTGIPDEPACGASDCSDGACARPDAGVDAAVPPDIDAGRDAGRIWPDTGPRDPGPPLVPALPCTSPVGADIAPYVEVDPGGTISFPATPGDVMELTDGTTIHIHFSFRDVFSPFTFLHVGNGSFDVSGCGFAYTCSSPTSGGDGFESLPNGRCTSSVSAVPTAGECEVAITARGGPVAFRRLDAECGRIATTPPVVDVRLDGMDSLSLPAPASAVLSWTATQAVSCVGTGTGWAGPQPASGSLALVDFLPAPHTFTLVCEGPVGGPAPGTALDTARFDVTP